MADPLEDVRYRPIEVEDGPFLYQVYARSRDEELARVPWTTEQKEAFLRQQFEAQHQYYQQHFGSAEYLVIERAGEKIGRLYVDRREGEIRVIDIALLPAWRGQGIGSALLQRLLEEAEQTGRMVTLHVENFNPARRLYERMGFRYVSETGVYHLMEWTAGAGRGR
jgi:ribosomal protein S18 acetylase RimI-like enzyme